MASFYTIMGQLQLTIQSLLSTPAIVVDGETIAPQVGVGWPSVKVLQDVARKGSGLVAGTVYDRKIVRNTTRWAPEVVAQTIVTATLTSAVSLSAIPPMGAATITLGGTVTLNDAVSAVLSVRGQGTGAQVAIGGGADTPDTVAAALAGQVNADPVLSTWVTAAASGPVVSFSNKLNVPIGLQSYTGNGGTQTTEVGRREQGVQVVLWCRTQPIRAAIVPLVQGYIAQADANFGFTTSDGTVVRMTYVSDYDIEDDTLEDVYRHDFMVSIEYPVTVLDTLYAVLAPVVAFEVKTTLQVN